MMEQNNPIINHRYRRRRSGLVGGLILVLIGLYALLNQYIPLDFGSLVLPLFGIVFIILAFTIHTRGFLISGAVLTALGAGVLLTTRYHISDPQKSAVLQLAFAAGWVLIPLLSMIYSWMDNSPRQWLWWPLAPAAALAITGLPILLGSAALQVMQLNSLAWPIIVILIGLFILLRRRR